MAEDVEPQKETTEETPFKVSDMDYGYYWGITELLDAIDGIDIKKEANLTDEQFDIIMDILDSVADELTAGIEVEDEEKEDELPS